MSERQTWRGPRCDEEVEDAIRKKAFEAGHRAGALMSAGGGCFECLNYKDASEKFHRETLRAAALAAMLREFIALHEDDHSPGPWSKGCVRCKLVGEAKELLSKPINDGEVIL